MTSAQQMILEALGGGNACLVAHYGLLTVGPNPRAAVSLASEWQTLTHFLRNHEEIQFFP